MDRAQQEQMAAERYIRERDIALEDNARLRERVRELEKANEVYQAKLDLHPTGVCRCWGEGWCQWCRMIAAQERAERAEAKVAAFEALMADSSGVYGLHLNGDPAPWDELLESEWLSVLADPEEPSGE